MMEIQDLPREIIMRIFGLLSPRDLKTSVLVCRTWRELGDDPRLWRWCIVTVKSGEDISNLSTARLQRVQYLRLEPAVTWQPGDWGTLFQAVVALSMINKIEGLRGKKLAAVEPSVLARTVAKLEDVDLSATELSTNQMTDILTHIAREDSKLKKLNLGENDLSAVDPADLAGGVSRLECVELFETSLSTEQITSMLVHIMEGHSNLTKLSLKLNDLSGVQPEVVARALSLLEEADLFRTELRPEQIASIFRYVTLKGTKLKILNLGENDLSNVEQETLETAFAILEEWDFEYDEFFSN